VIKEWYGSLKHLAEYFTVTHPCAYRCPLQLGKIHLVGDLRAAAPVAPALKKFPCVLFVYGPITSPGLRLDAYSMWTYDRVNQRAQCAPGKIVVSGKVSRLGTYGLGRPAHQLVLGPALSMKIAQP